MKRQLYEAALGDFSGFYGSRQTDYPLPGDPAVYHPRHLLCALLCAQSSASVTCAVANSPATMDNRKTLYLLIAALILAALTGRWMTDGPTLPSADSSDETYFHMQRIAFTMTLAALVILILNWQNSGEFPKAIYFAIALILYFVGTGTPQTQKAGEWARGNVGVMDWFGTNPIEGISGEVAQRLSGAWKSPGRTYTIQRDALYVVGAGETETLDKTACPGDASYFRFGYATEDVFQFNAVAEPYLKLLREPPVPMFEASCNGVLYTFLLQRDNTLVAFKNLHRRSAVVEILTRGP